MKNSETLIKHWNLNPPDAEDTKVLIISIPQTNRALIDEICHILDLALQNIFDGEIIICNTEMNLIGLNQLETIVNRLKEVQDEE